MKRARKRRGESVETATFSALGINPDRLNAARGMVIGRTPYELERLRLDIHGFRF